MRRPGAALLCALALACSWGEPEPPESATPATPAEPAAPPQPPAPEPVPEPPAPDPPAPPASAPAEPPPAPPAPPGPALDLEGLEARLRETRALGVLTKLALKNEIDDLVRDVAGFHEKARGELGVLRERFDLLVMKVMTLVQEGAPQLADEIARSRQGLWTLLADPAEFAKLRT